MAGLGRSVFPKITNTALLVLLAFVGQCAYGANKDGKYVVIGHHTCGDWHEAERQNPMRRELLAMWLFGFISGVNSQTPSKNVAVSGSQIKAFVDQYCSNNPLHPLVAAGAALVDEMGGPKTEHESRK